MWTQRAAHRAGKPVDVFEFTEFMDELLRHHPEIVTDQHRGWARYWQPQTVLVEEKKEREDSVPIDDHLGTISRSD
jgi:hypothetical protein